MSYPRGLSAEEQAAWSRLAASVTPMEGRKVPPAPASNSPPVHVQPDPIKPAPRTAPGLRKPASLRAPSPQTAPRRHFSSELDGHWDRKLKAGQIVPDYTLDLHGHNLDGAYTRIIGGLDQARAMNARVVLVIAGRSRPVDPADRGQKRAGRPR